MAFGLKHRCKTIGYNGENLVAEILRECGFDSKTTGYKHSLDVIVPDLLGIEVKTLTKDRRFHIDRTQRRYKRDYCTRHNLRGVTVAVYMVDQIIDEGTGQIIDIADLRYKDGFKSFDVNRMNDFKELIKNVGGKIPSED